MDKVRFGYFSDFSDPTLLFFGSEKALNGMKDLLMSLQEGDVIQLDKDSHFQPIRDTRVMLSLAKMEQEGSITFIEAGKPCLQWHPSKMDIADIIEKLDVVIGSTTPCHHYLDSFSMDDEVVVQVSKGEFPDDFGQ
tara:strand:- start:1081 stop:1488 length:408 start_codon:yes stop_codon:yes gene_type:complete